MPSSTICRTRLGRPVFEIPSLPPSVPGMRLFEILHHALRAAGGRIAIGAGVVAHERSGDRIASIDTATAGSPTTYAADWFVLASGGFHSGAITLDSHWHTRETIFDLPLGVSRPPASPASPPRTSTSSRWRWPGSRSTTSCAPMAPRTSSSPAPRSRAPPHGARAPARASRWPPASRRRAWSPPRGRGALA